MDKQLAALHVLAVVKQARYKAIQGFAGMWGHGNLGFKIWRLIYEVVGSINRSKLEIGRQAESYRV